MITLKDFMEVVDYRITEGSVFCWNCFGPNAYRLDSWMGDGVNSHYTVSVTFDTKDQTVYQAEVYDYNNDRAYRMVNPEFDKAQREEAREREVDIKQAWDDINFVDLESAEDFLEKTRAIIAGEDYDVRVSIPLDIPEDVLFVLMRRAHEEDITLNQLFEQILKEQVQRLADEKGIVL